MAVHQITLESYDANSSRAGGPATLRSDTFEITVTAAAVVVTERAVEPETEEKVDEKPVEVNLCDFSTETIASITDILSTANYDQTMPAGQVGISTFSYQDVFS